MSDRDIVEELREESLRLAGHSIDRGSADAGIAANLAYDAADGIERLHAELAMAGKRSLALAGAASASDGLAELLRYAREGDNHLSPFGDVDVVAHLLDAVRIALEIESENTEENSQMFGAIVRYLEYRC